MNRRNFILVISLLISSVCLAQQNMGIVYAQADDGVDKVLDLYGSDPVAAYSVRKLDRNYAGYCMKIRRSSGSPSTTYIGFVGEDIDESAITTFCSGTNCYVETWFDQSGNNRNARQATTSDQPKIYDSSTGLLTHGLSSKLALDFDGSNDNFEIADMDALTANDYTVHTVLEVDAYGAGATDPFFWDFKGTNEIMLFHDNTTDRPHTKATEWQTSTTTTRYGSAMATATHYILYTLIDQANNENNLYIDNVNISEQASPASVSAAGSTSKIGVKGDEASGTYFDGKYQELIVYAIDNITDRTDLFNNQDAYFRTNASPEVEQDNLVLHVEADQYSGSGDWLDLTSNNNDGTITGATFDATNDWFSFDGTSGNHITFGDITAFDDQSFSVQIWINIESGAASPMLYSKMNGGFIDGFYYTWDINDDGRLEMHSPELSPQSSTTGEKTVAEEWLFLTMTYDGSNVRHYINGYLAHTEARTGTIANTSVPFRISGRDNGANPFEGEVRACLVYDDVLTLSEIQNNYKVVVNEGVDAPNYVLNEGTQGNDIKAAYAIRLLDNTFFDPILRIRRDNDNAEIFLFTQNYLGEHLWESGINDFCSGTDCFVTTWSDQSGSGLDFTESTASDQPIIYDDSDGDLQKLNGRVAINFDGSNDEMEVASSTDDFAFLHKSGKSAVSYVGHVDDRANPDLATFVFGNNNNGTVNTGVHFGVDDRSSSSRDEMLRWSIYKGSASNEVVQPLTNNTVTLGSQVILFFDSDPNNGTATDRLKFYEDNTFVTTSNPETNTPATGNASYDMQIGSDGGSGNHFNGMMQELFFFDGDKSGNKDDIYDNQNDYYRAVQTQDLVLFLDAEDTDSYSGSGSTWTDLSAQGNDGTITGATFNSGGKYFEFDGNDYVDCASSADFTLGSSDDYTIQIYLYPDVSDDRMIMGTWESYNSGFNNRWELAMWSNNDIIYGTSGGGIMMQPDEPTISAWTLVTVVRTSGTNYIYYDDDSTSKASSTGPDDFTSQNRLRIGDLSDYDGFDGRIKKVLIYDRALSTDEIRSNYLLFSN